MSSASAAASPSITLLGTRADWESMIPRVRHLSEYGLAWWTGALVPILEQLARTADGDVDRAFWRSFFRYESGSGSAELTGWIVALFPYITDWRTKELERSPYVANWGERFRVSEARTGCSAWERSKDRPSACSPRGSLAHPCALVDLATGEASDVRFVAGMFGVAQAEDTGALSSTFGWAVVRESTGHEQRAHPRSCARGPKSAQMKRIDVALHVFAPDGGHESTPTQFTLPHVVQLGAYSGVCLRLRVLEDARPLQATARRGRSLVRVPRSSSGLPRCVDRRGWARATPHELLRWRQPSRRTRSAPDDRLVPRPRGVRHGRGRPRACW
jgi:hypothetical protein